MVPSNLLHRTHRKLLTQAGLPHDRFRDLRQTYATLARRGEVPVKMVSETL